METITEKTTEPRRRLSRYERQPGKARKIVLTDGDREIFELFAEYRMLTVALVSRLLHRSEKRLHRRLAPLWHHGYLSRSPLFDPRWPEGAGKAVYGLGPNAIAELREPPHDTRLLRERVRRQERMGLNNLRHGLLVSRLQMVIFEACRDSDVLQLGFRRDLDDRHLGVKVRIPGHRDRITVWPDSFFVLERAGNAYYFFGESETESGARRERKRQEAKFLAYQALLADRGLLKKHYGIPANAPCFVLYHTETNQVMKTLRRVLEETRGIRGNNSLFWFLSEETAAGLPEPAQLFTRDVVSGIRGRPGSLLPRTAV